MVFGERSDGRIDRERTCPLLLRIFCGNCAHNKIRDYSRDSFPVSELQAYTWLDATLFEISSLIMQVNPEACRKGTSFDFSIVYPDPQSPNYKMRHLGSICSGFPTDADKIMLKDSDFRIGDMLDVAVTPPPESFSGSGGNRRFVRRDHTDEVSASVENPHAQRRRDFNGGNFSRGPRRGGFRP